MESHAQRLNSRRKALKMSYTALAARSGVSEPTVKRILNGGNGSIGSVEAIAEALGARLSLDAPDVDEFIRSAADQKARWIVKLVQGTSALEAQAVPEAEYEAMVHRTTEELLAGSPRKLW